MAPHRPPIGLAAARTSIRVAPVETVDVVERPRTRSADESISSSAETRSGRVSDRILTCSLTEAGAALARRLPFEHRHSGLMAAVAERWNDVDGFVLVCATGIAVRAVAPHLGDKAHDPAVVVVDDGGRFAIALAGGHQGGANDLARQVAALLGAEPVITTATDTAGLPALDTLPGFTAAGDIAAVTRAWLDGHPPELEVDPTLAAWPFPNLDAAPPVPDSSPSDMSARDDTASDIKGLPMDGGGQVPTAGASRLPPASRALRTSDRSDEPTVGRDPVRNTDQSDTLSPAPGTVRITDSSDEPGARQVLLRPKSLVVGIGASSGAAPDGLRKLVFDTLTEAGLHPDSVAAVATIDLKRDEPAIVALANELDVPLRTMMAGALAATTVPNPSAVVGAAVGTPSVAEAAALLAAGADAQLVVEKHKSAEATVAVARRVRPEGQLAVVSLGPGEAQLRTPAATAAVRQAEVVIGFSLYVDLVADLLTPAQHVVRSPIGAEADRCRAALQAATNGRRVALVCSGDAGVFAMASLVCELAPAEGDPPVVVVPGVTAALAGAALLGAPLGHDHAAISLSDLLTPWDIIEKRIQAIAEADMAVSFYNPRSQRRVTQLERALAILGAHRPADTPAAILTDIGRPGQRVITTTLAKLDPADVDMLSLVVVGSSTTRYVGDRMVTPRGYDA